MKDLLDKQLHFHQGALNLRAQRQELLASNIANADTPHYKAQDIDFKEALKARLGEATSWPPLALASTKERHIAPAPVQGDTFRRFRTEYQSSVDGNTVNMDVERGEFAKNSMQYEASLTFINSMLSGMQRAISGQ
jgi:flagellar basal-body rod protein FlgB